MDWARWKGPLTIVVVVGAIVGVLVWIASGPSQPPPPAPIASASTPSIASSSAPIVASAPPPPPSVVPSVPPSSTGLVLDAGQGWAYFELPDGGLVPLPPGADRESPIASAPPPKELPQTPDWKLEKTQEILTAVEDRAKRTEQEIADLRAKGQTEEAAHKEVLLHRLNAQITSMKREIADYQSQIEAGVAP